MENARAHLAYLDEEFRFVHVNRAYAEGSGHPPEELLGRGHFELFPNAENEAIFRQVRETGQAVEFRAKPFQYADQPGRGVTYWDWRLAPVKDGQERVRGFVLSLNDVTEQVRTNLHLLEAYDQVRNLNRRLAEGRREARRRASQLRLLIENLAEGVVIVDDRGKVLLMNRAAGEILGLGPTVHPRGRFEPEVFRLDGRPLPAEDWPLQAPLRGVAPPDEEFLIERPDGTRRQVASNYGVLRDEQGKVVLVVATFWDVTELRRLERAKDDYLQVLAHELRNPLAAAYGLVQLVRGGLSPENRDRAGEHLRLAEAELRRLDRLVQEIITGYRVSSGRLPLDLSPLDLRDVVAEAVAPGQALYGANFTVEDLPAGRFCLMGDRKRLVEVLANLLSNALKYSPPDSPIRLRAVPAGARSVVVEVEDRGIGIPPDQLDRVFEGFYRATNLPEREPGGIGLGLYISRDIARRHGGDLWAENRLGGGTVMRLRLPLTS